MEPTTLDEAKANARCFRDDPRAYCSDTERTAAALLTALEAAEKQVATIRAEAFEEAAKVADAEADAAEATWRTFASDSFGEFRHRTRRTAALAIATKIRALATKPPAETVECACYSGCASPNDEPHQHADDPCPVHPERPTIPPADPRATEAPFDARKAIPDRTTVAMHLFAALWADPDSTEEGCVTAAFRGADVFLAAAGNGK